MSSSAALNEIGTILEQMIESQWEDDPKILGLKCPKITFDSPYDLVKRAAEGNQYLSLFLFHVSENTYLKNSLADTFFDNATGSEMQPDLPLALDLIFLVTAISTTGTSQDPTNEKRILGRVMQIFNDNREIRSAAPSVPTIRIYLHTMSSEEIARIWTSFPETPYRLSVAYLVTPVFIDSIRHGALPKRVVDRSLGSAQAEKRSDV
ncbi:MAG: DUF4255 domain-containing protein [Methanoregula sp.]|jgi:hypothetical protein